jgi:hypothetical protein
MNGDSFVQTPRRPKDRKRGQRRRATPPGPRGGGGTSVFGGTLLDQLLFRLNFPITVVFPRGGGGGASNQPPGALNFRAPPNPVTPPVPQTQIGPFRFPNVIPQGADVVLKKGATVGVGRLFGVGGLIISAAQILVDELEERQLERMQDILDEQDELQRDKDRRRARDSVVETIPVGRADAPPGGFPDEPQAPFIVIQPVFLPEFPSPSRTSPRPTTDQPAPVRPEFEIAPGVIPAAQPAPPAIPSPVPVTSPVVQPFPGQFESPSPFGLPSPAPSIFPQPLTSFFIGDLLERAIPFESPLTTSEVATVPSTGTGTGTGIAIPIADAGIQPLLQTQTQFQQAQTECKPRKCDDEMDEPRTECMKGLYREGFFDTEFVPWNEIDCLTGKEL